LWTISFLRLLRFVGAYCQTVASVTGMTANFQTSANVKQAG
jgi:hypothetical protein